MSYTVKFRSTSWPKNVWYQSHNSETYKIFKTKSAAQEGIERNALVTDVEGLEYRVFRVRPAKKAAKKKVAKKKVAKKKVAKRGKL